MSTSPPQSPAPATCPDCASRTLYRSGYAADGQQRYVCRDCGRSFQMTFQANGFDTALRAEALAMYLAGSTQTAIHQALKISYGGIRSIIKGHRRGRVLPPCPRCGDDDTCRFGKADDRVTQRYRCKACGKTYTSEADGTGDQQLAAPDTRNLKN